MPLFVGEEKMVRYSVVYCKVKVHFVGLRGEFSVGLCASVKELLFENDEDLMRLSAWGASLSARGVPCVGTFSV